MPSLTLRDEVERLQALFSDSERREAGIEPLADKARNDGFEARRLELEFDAELFRHGFRHVDAPSLQLAVLDKLVRRPVVEYGDIDAIGLILAGRASWSFWSTPAAMTRCVQRRKPVRGRGAAARRMRPFIVHSHRHRSLSSGSRTDRCFLAFARPDVARPASKLCERSHIETPRQRARQVVLAIVGER